MRYAILGERQKSIYRSRIRKNSELNEFLRIQLPIKVDLNLPLVLVAAYFIFACSSLIAIAHCDDESTSSVPTAVARTAGDSAIESAPATWQSLAIYPHSIKLGAKTDSQHVIAVATRSDGITQDVTGQAEWKFANPDLAQIESNILTPKADGISQITAQWQGLTSNVDLHVTNSQLVRTVSFARDVMPILTKVGCNTGSCHGAARGKDGFRMSLFGYDPAGDYQRITREIGIRRINLAVPEQSLILLKATGSVQHTGGRRFELGSRHYQTLLTWLKAGALIDATKPPAVTAVDVYPNQAVMEGETANQQLVAVATYADGSQRDVLELASFTTNNERTAAVAADGNITSGVRGEAFVMARFDTYTMGTQVLALPAKLRIAKMSSSDSYVDNLVNDKLQKLRLPSSDICSDDEFVRRSTIDITGLLPTEDETAAFIASVESDKRGKWVDTLLERREFSEIWAMKWADLLMIKSKNNFSYKAAYLYNNWLTNKIASNTPIDKIVRELLTATGGTFQNPATNFYQVELDRLKLAENVAQTFMGIRTQCAQCHNHPFDRWTMNDYYGFNAFFSQVGRKQSEDYRQVLIFNSGGGDVKHPVGGAVVQPKFLGGSTPDVNGKDRRVVLAEWITSTDNPYFAKSISNRIWAHFNGVGIVNPVDDFRASNPPSNPELLDELAKRLVEYGFDTKRLVRDICNSLTYQRSCTPNVQNQQDERNYSHAIVRRIPSESMLDCISQVTETKEKFRGLPIGARAVQIADGATSNYFLTSFGRSARTTVCADEANTDPSLSQALHLINGNATSGKISQGALLKKWKESGLNKEAIIEKIYVRCLSRKPSESERANLVKLVADSPNEDQGLHDVFWAILNSREFIFNH